MICLGVSYFKDRFVFDDRGQIPKVDLSYGNAKPVSEYTFQYFTAKYGACKGEPLTKIGIPIKSDLHNIL